MQEDKHTRWLLLLSDIEALLDEHKFSREEIVKAIDDMLAMRAGLQKQLEK